MAWYACCCSRSIARGSSTDSSGSRESSLGVDIDYRSVRIAPLTGVEVEDLVVLSPTYARPFARELVRVGHLSVGWVLGSLVRGGTPAIRRLAISNVALSVVVDEENRTSFDAFSSPRKTRDPAPVPLSRLASTILAKAPPVAKLDIGPITIAMVRTEHGVECERAELQGLSAAMTAAPAPASEGGWGLDLSLGSSESPLDITLTRTPRDTPQTVFARAGLWIEAHVDGHELTTTFDMRWQDPSRSAGLPAQHWLQGVGRLSFDPSRGRTEVTIAQSGEAGDTAVGLNASVEIPDDGAPVIDRARGSIDIARLLSWLPPSLLPDLPATLERATLSFDVDSLMVGAAPALSKGATIHLGLDVTKLDVTVPGVPLEVGSFA